MFCLLPQLLFYYLTSNLLFAPPPPFSHHPLFFPQSPTLTSTQSLISHYYLFIPFHLSLFIVSPPPKHPDCGLVWPFNVSLCFSFPLTPPILPLSFRLQLMPSSVCSLLEPNFQSHTRTVRRDAKRRRFFVYLLSK